MRRKKKKITVIIILVMAGIVFFNCLPIFQARNSFSQCVKETTPKELWRFLQYHIRKKFDPEKVESREEFLFPSKEIDTQYFVMTSYSGWITSADNDITHSLYKRLLDSFKAEDHTHGFEFAPYFIINRSIDDAFEETNLHSKFYIFLKKMQSLQETKNIADKTCVYLRYSGKNSFNSNSLDGIACNQGKQDSVTICFQFDDLSAWGYFWGFEEDEKVFWECLNSIEWKK